ncbi:DUF2382 domain-containing protein [Thermithiobacillus plumbiphilus]|uniref:DUF2382 domain-containing protein n=1 Tax=Thermithiobacillus plumbiphilus TaxID=1729899 RepID=A0ABU9D8W9_9PROT
MTKTVIGLFDDRRMAEKVVKDLTDAGFARDDISLVARDEQSGSIQETADDSSHESKGAHIAKDAAGGAVIGGLGGLVVGLASLALPGVGGIIAAGPIAATLTGAGIGAVAGGLVGALTDVGVPEEHAHSYAEGVRRGGTLVMVKTADDRAEEAADILDRHGAADIEERSAQWRQGGWTPGSSADTGTRVSSAGIGSGMTSGAATGATPGMSGGTTPDISRTGSTTSGQRFAGSGTAGQSGMAADADRSGRGTASGQGISGAERSASGMAGAREDQVIPVVEEDLQIDKRAVQRGGVRVYTHATERPVTEQVQLRDEEVKVQRRPVDRPASEADLRAFQEGSIEVTETDEVLVVAKEARVVEEVEVSKTAHMHTETIQDTVRGTDVSVEPLAAGAADDFEIHADEFRTDYQNRYSNRGMSYEQLSPAYRYGYHLGMDQRYRGGDWDRVEADARRDWEQQHQHEGPWERFKDAVRYGWDRARTPHHH